MQRAAGLSGVLQLTSARDPLGNREQGRDAPRFKDLIERYVAEHLPHLAPTNASDQKSMLRKLVAPIDAKRTSRHSSSLNVSIWFGSDRNT